MQTEGVEGFGLSHCISRAGWLARNFPFNHAKPFGDYFWSQRQGEEEAMA